MGSGERKVDSWRLTGDGKLISGTRKTFSSAVPVSIGTLRV